MFTNLSVGPFLVVCSSFPRTIARRGRGDVPPTGARLPFSPELEDEDSHWTRLGIFGVIGIVVVASLGRARRSHGCHGCRSRRFGHSLILPDRRGPVGIGAEHSRYFEGRTKSSG